MRFETQIKSAGFSEKKQEKLLNAKVLVIGAGGLGCPALQYLAAVGVGTIGIVDGDVISASNLNRQVLFGENDIGKFKTHVAAYNLNSKYTEIKINCYPEYLTVENALQIIPDYDLVLDCTDNFSARYLTNDACVLLKKHLVFGAIFQHEGQVMAFDPTSNPALNYRHVYPNPPAPNEIPDCNSTGVIGVLPGIIGIMMVNESIKLLTGFGSPLVNKILCYGIINNSIYEMHITENPEAERVIPKTKEQFLQYNYSFHCAINNTISWEKAMTSLLTHSHKIILVDVRETEELPKLNNIAVTNLPLSQLNQFHHLVSKGEIIYVFCQSGIRSNKAILLLKNIYPDKTFFSIKGGITDSLSPANHNYHERT